MAKSDRVQVRFLGFNQDSSCLAVGTDRGYKIFTTDNPVRKCYEKQDGGVRIVSMLNRTSLWAIVGLGADSTQQSPRQLQLYNTSEDQSICSMSFQDTILSVKLNKKRLVVILEKCLHIFDLTKMASLQIIDTEPNPKGLGALSMGEDCVVAYPKAVQPGCGDVMVVDAISTKNIHVIRAHRNPLSALALSNCGTKLATASQKGTVIRVFGLSPGGKAEAPLLYTLRRGASMATVHSLCFNEAATLLACTSSKTTIHIWKCDTVAHHEGNSDGPGTMTDAVRNLYNADRSWVQFQAPSSSVNVVALSKDSRKVFVATMDGHLYIHSLDLANGDCKREAEYILSGSE